MPPKASLDDVLKKQLGVLTRRQALNAGFTEAMIGSRGNSGRWQRLFDGVYLTAPSAPTLKQRAWAVCWPRAHRQSPAIRPQPLSWV